MATASTTADQKECCLCGDVGFSSDLFPCPACGFRVQHIYCSSSYPNVDREEWRCEWCVHEQTKEQDRPAWGQKQSKAAAVDVRRGVDEGSSDEEEMVRIVRRRPRSSDHSVVPDGDKRLARSTSAGAKTLKVKTRGAERGWRSRLRHCSSTSSGRAVGRRYKLLADVFASINYKTCIAL